MEDEGDQLIQQASQMQQDHQSQFAQSFRSNVSMSDLSQVRVNYPYKELDFWEPQLRKMRGHGMVHSEKFSWPNHTVLKEFDLSKVIKLCGIELGMTSNLYQIRLHFTGGLRSPMLRAEHAGVQSQQGDDDQGHKLIEIDPRKTIAEVVFSQNAKSGMI